MRQLGEFTSLLGMSTLRFFDICSLSSATDVELVIMVVELPHPVKSIRAHSSK